MAMLVAIRKAARSWIQLPGEKLLAAWPRSKSEDTKIQRRVVGQAGPEARVSVPALLPCSPRRVSNHTSRACESCLC